MKLPHLMMITGQNPTNYQDFIHRISGHLEQGIQLIQFRAKELSSHDYHALASELIELTKGFGATLIFNGPQHIPNQHTHLTSQELMQTNTRPNANYLLSASCHNQDQLLHAQRLGCDLVTLSPVQPTKTHPRATPLGWKQFEQLCQLVSIPIYALGGLTENDLIKAQAVGAYGVAAISALWDRVYPTEYK